ILDWIAGLGGVADLTKSPGVLGRFEIGGGPWILAWTAGVGGGAGLTGSWRPWTLRDWRAPFDPDEVPWREWTSLDCSDARLGLGIGSIRTRARARRIPERPLFRASRSGL